jgi:hypothetical protein
MDLDLNPSASSTERIDDAAAERAIRRGRCDAAQGDERDHHRHDRPSR